MSGGGIRILAVLALPAAGLAACSTTSAPAPVATLSSAPAPVEGYDWFLMQDGAGSQLVYGLDQSDEVKLSLACDGGDGTVEVSAPGRPGDHPEILLESGGDTVRLTAHVEPMGLTDEDWLTASSRASEPVFQRFRSLGWMAHWQGRERQTYAAHPGSQDRIGRFFARCGA